MGQQRSYTREYKVQAVKLVLEVGITKAARELGVCIGINMSNKKSGLKCKQVV